MSQHKPKIEKKGVLKKRWKIKRVKAIKDDEITWEANDGDITIWFPPGMDPLEIHQKTISSGTSLTRKIPPNVTGTYEYSIFCHKDKQMVEGNSPPQIIID
ncbi:MAG: hypothetical protein ACE5IW_09920 [bacterium]